MPDSLLPAPKHVLNSWIASERQFAKASGLHWADTSEGAGVIDLVPNPKRFLIGELMGFKVAMDCGEPGMGIRPPQT